MKKQRKPKGLKLSRGERFVCKCECGGNVIGQMFLGRLSTWCDRCTPVVKVKID